MPGALARVGLALVVEVAALVPLVLHRLGGHQPAVLAVTALPRQSQAHQLHALAAAVAVVIMLLVLLAQQVERAAAGTAARIWGVLLVLVGLA
jgi:hypothetical protein